MLGRGETRSGAWTRWVVAGLVGGVAYALYKMMALWAIGMGFWTALNALATVFSPFRPTAHGFAWGPVLTGACLVLVVGVIWGLIVGWVAETYFAQAIRSWGGSTLLGLAWGLAVGLAVTLWIGPSLVPELVTMSPGNTFVGCLLAALVAHWTLTAQLRRRGPAITFSPGAPVEQVRPLGGKRGDG